MNNPPLDRRVRKTRQAIREGFIQLMAEKNIQDISVQELADRVDIHRGTFYLHYRDIYDLYEQLEDEVIAELQQLFVVHGIEGGSSDDVDFILEKILIFVEENEEICSMLMAQGMSGTFVKKLSDVFKNKFLHLSLEHMELGATAEEVTYLSDFLVFGYIAVITNWLENGMPEPPEVMAERIGKFGAYGVRYYQPETY